MTDRTVLAEALQGSTVEQLRADADVACQLALAGEYPTEDAMHRRLAALALAVADLMDGGVSQVSVSADCPTSLSLPDGRVFDGGTLTASLAQLLRGAP